MGSSGAELRLSQATCLSVAGLGPVFRYPTSRNNLHSLGSTQQRISASSGELLHIHILFYKRRKQGTWDERSCNDFTASHPKTQAEKAGTLPHRTHGCPLAATQRREKWKQEPDPPCKTFCQITAQTLVLQLPEYHRAYSCLPSPKCISLLKVQQAGLKHDAANANETALESFNFTNHSQEERKESRATLANDKEPPHLHTHVWGKAGTS